MFCPNCGKAEQSPNTYCRNCGEFLPDLVKKTKRASFGGDTPEEQIRTNLFLNALSAFVSLALAISIYVVFYGSEPVPLIYLTAAFLLAMSGWQFSTCYINLKLRKNFKRRRDTNDAVIESNRAAEIETVNTKKLLAQADLTNAVPTSVTENTTKILHERIKKTSS